MPVSPPRKAFPFHRIERRIPMEISVLLEGHHRVPGTESTFTENVSAHGARVLSTRRWQKDERLMFVLHSGEFRSSARVAYCQTLQSEGFAIGVQFLEPKGRWVVQSPR